MDLYIIQGMISGLMFLPGLFNAIMWGIEYIIGC